MKHIFQSSKMIIPITALVFFVCWNGSMVDSNGKDKRPDTNFYGTLQDHTTSFDVEDILIGGKYEQIPVYQKVDPIKKTAEKISVDQTKSSLAEIDPKQNKILLDLHEISSISLQYPDKPIEHELEINNRKYVEIVVTSINNTKQNYLIESSREVSCLKMDKGPDKDQKPIFEERKLNMIHIKNLEIKGFKSAIDSKQSKYQERMSTDKMQVSDTTEKILDQIEEKVKDLPKQDPSQYEKFKTSLLSLLRSLREQLQKMLNMIKN